MGGGYQVPGMVTEDGIDLPQNGCSTSKLITGTRVPVHDIFLFFRLYTIKFAYVIGSNFNIIYRKETSIILVEQRWSDQTLALSLLLPVSLYLVPGTCQYL